MLEDPGSCGGPSTPGTRRRSSSGGLFPACAASRGSQLRRPCTWRAEPGTPPSSAPVASHVPAHGVARPRLILLQPRPRSAPSRPQPRRRKPISWPPSATACWKEAATAQTFVPGELDRHLPLMKPGCTNTGRQGGRLPVSRAAQELAPQVSPRRSAHTHTWQSSPRRGRGPYPAQVSSSLEAWPCEL